MTNVDFSKFSLGLLGLGLFGCIETQNIEVATAPGQKAASSNSAPLPKLGEGVASSDLSGRLQAVQERIQVLRARMTEIENEKVALETDQGSRLTELQNTYNGFSQQVQGYPARLLGLNNAVCSEIEQSDIVTQGSQSKCRLKPYGTPPTQPLSRVRVNEASFFNCIPGSDDTCVVRSSPGQAGTRNLNQAQMVYSSGPNPMRSVDSTRIRTFSIAKHDECQLIEVKVRAHGSFLGSGQAMIRFRLRQNGGNPNVLTACEPDLVFPSSGGLAGCSLNDNWHPKFSVLRDGDNKLVSDLQDPYEINLNQFTPNDSVGVMASGSRDFFVLPSQGTADDNFTLEVSHSPQSLPTGGTITIWCHPRNVN